MKNKLELSEGMETKLENETKRNLLVTLIRRQPTGNNLSTAKIAKTTPKTNHRLRKKKKTA